MAETWLIEGKYEVISKIKQGGFGIVYYGFDKKFEKPIAIKAIEPGLLQEAKYIDMFLKEAKNAAKLNHNNIVHVYDLIKTDDGQFYIIMEYIDGVDLKRIFKKCISQGVTIPLNLGIYIVKELCKALEYAHNKRDLISKESLNLVHQDISPSNIMISTNGNVKLIDFGIAKIKFHRNGDQHNVVLVGKLPYMAPEQLNGFDIDKRTDLFSLGTVFYEILTLKRLFQAEDDEKIIEIIRKGRIDQKLFNKQIIPESIQHILIKSLQKDVKDRYQGANEIYIDLVEYLMKSVQSVELSIELGSFIRGLFSDELANKHLLAQAEEKSDEDKKHLEKSDLIQGSLQKEKLPPETRQQETQSPGLSKKDSDKTNPLIQENEDIEDDKLILRNTTEIPLTDKKLLEIKSEKEITTQKQENADKAKQAPSPAISEIPKKISKITTPSFSTFEEEIEGADDIKTVIDVIRLSAKTHKKTLIWGSIAVLVAFTIFMILNITFRMTTSGQKIYDYLFPPVIKIISSPPGAKVFIDDKLVPGTTPLTIPKISPGVHKLSLSYPGFSTLIRSLHVPSKGAVKVAGEKTRKGYEPYVFHFKTLIEVNSNPPEATIIINNIKYKQKTPTTIDWEVGVPFAIQLIKSGFEDLTGFSLNTLDETVEIEDRRLWNFTVLEEENRKYNVEGVFKKFVRIASLPSEVTFYLDGSPTPTGKTGSAQAVALSVGNHDILFTRAGFNSKRIRIKVDENSPESIYVILTRNVRFFAKDITDPNDNEIGATIARIYRQGRSFVRDDKTPCEIALPPVNHKVLIKKDGYDDAVVVVSPTAKAAIAKMRPQNVNIEVTVIDALTEMPIKDVQILYSGLNEETESETNFGLTNEYGRCINKLNPGQYTFKVKKSGYFEKSANINTLNGENKLTFKLIIQ